jgi:TonB family protein
VSQVPAFVLAIALTSLTSGANTAAAQTFGGEVLESRIGQPIRSFPVRLVRLRTADSVEICDSTVTDERGLFQMPGRGPGQYRLQFGRPGSRVETNALVEAESVDATIVRRYTVPILELAGADAFAASEVQEAARPHTVVPLRFPKELQHLRMPGEVRARYVVDPSGHPVPESLIILSSTHPAFTRAVRDVLRTVVWEPAHIGGVAVPQWVDQPLTFSFSDPR